MREIKFRVFGGSKRMIPWSELCRLHIGTVFQTAPDYYVMQFTGLRDKNGKEIYEGDIVSAWFPHMPNNMRAIQEIMFIDGCFGCGDYPLKLVDREAFLEVIGNIYENPELIEKM